MLQTKIKTKWETCSHGLGHYSCQFSERLQFTYKGIHRYCLDTGRGGGKCQSLREHSLYIPMAIFKQTFLNHCEIGLWEITKNIVCFYWRIWISCDFYNRTDNQMSTSVLHFQGSVGKYNFKTLQHKKNPEAHLFNCIIKNVSVFL